MAIDFPCWNCGKNLKAADSSAGKKCKCTGCSQINTIPGIAKESLSVDEPIELREPKLANTNEPLEAEILNYPTAPPLSSNDPTDLPFDVQETSISRQHLRMYSKEPWYYRLIGAVANGSVILAVVGSVGLAFLILIVAIIALFETRNIGDVFVAIYFYFLIFIGLVGYLFLWSFVLLLLDMARNLRALKLHLTKSSG